MPLPTLSFTITAAGISAPTYAQILQSLIESFQSIYGADAYLQPDSQDYEWLAVLASGYNDQNQAAIALYNSFSPTYGQGVGLSSMVKINGLRRLVPTASSATVTFTGTAGVVIPINFPVQDQLGNIWNTTGAVTVGSGGTVNATVLCAVLGAVAAAPDTISILGQRIVGLQSVTNSDGAAPGAPVESDAALRQRQAVSTSLPAETPLSAIAANLANLTGTTRSFVYENPTGSTDGNGVLAYSIEAVVENGTATDLAIATAIQEKKSPGTGTCGGTAVVVTDPSGETVTINFDHLAYTQIYVTVDITRLAGYVAGTDVVIAASLVAFINALGIGQAAIFSWIEALAQNIQPGTLPTYEVTATYTGTSASPSGTTDIPVAFNYAAQTDLTKIVINVT